MRDHAAQLERRLLGRQSRARRRLGELRDKREVEDRKRIEAEAARMAGNDGVSAAHRLMAEELEKERKEIEKVKKEIDEDTRKREKFQADCHHALTAPGLAAPGVYPGQQGCACGCVAPVVPGDAR